MGMTTIERAEVLKNYTENDRNINFRRVDPTLRKLISQKERNTYHHDEAFDDFMYVAEGGAKNYGAEFDVNWKEMFSEEVRKIVAQAWLNEFEAERP
jgi:hypothetical protein